MKSWSKKFVLACGTISLTIGGPVAAQPAPAKMAVLALLDSGDLSEWRKWTQDAGWRLIAPEADAKTPIDSRIQALQKAVLEAIQSGSADPARIYLAGRGEASAAVFYTVSRGPDLWAAAAALGGSPQPAIDTGRFYPANFTNVPVLWVGTNPGDRALAGTLHAAGLPLDFRASGVFSARTLFSWLTEHTRADYPPTIDCETNSPRFGRCYWIRMTKFDAAERNDALASTSLQPSVRAALDLGGFGFNKNDPGPGVLVTFLPDKYPGPLKLGDRIVALDGRDLPDARRYLELMSQVSEERPAVATVQRGKERIRIETRLVLPQRAPAVTARVQAKYLAEDKQVQIVSRAVTEMQVDLPAQWVPAVLNWNGVPLENVAAPGCRLLSIEKAIESASACP